MTMLERIAVPAWAQALMRAAPWIVLGVLVAALVVQRTTVIRVTGERDRIIHVLDPATNATADTAIVAANRVFTERDAANHALTATVQNYRRASADAKVADLNHARAIEQRDADINVKVQHDLKDQLVSARADADAHALRMRSSGSTTAAASADRGSGGIAHLSRPADAASGAARPNPSTDVDDSRACAAGIVLAEGWQRWWTEIAASPR